MTLDRSLKIHGGLVRTRSVLTRAERITMLTEEGKFDPIVHSPLGLPKVKVRHSKAGTKTKKEEKPVEGAAEGEAAAGAPAPAVTDARAAKGEARAVKGDARAAKGEARPAKGDGRAAKGDARPAKGDARAAKGDAKTAKGGKG